MEHDQQMQKFSRDLFAKMIQHRYSYNFNWLGRPVIQFPQDLLTLQEIIWSVRPQVIVETGIAHGGSLIFHASMLQLLGGAGEVIGIDVEIRPQNRRDIENHPLYPRITLFEGSSTDARVAAKVYDRVGGKSPVMVVLDSNHTHDHVLAELELYSRVVTAGSYLVVLDTVIEEIPDELIGDRPWKKGNNPKTAVKKFLESNSRFQIDSGIEKKLLLTVAPGGYLKCVG